MRNKTEFIGQNIQALLKGYFSDQEEENLSEIYELGRSAADEEVGILEMLDLFRAAIDEVNSDSLNKDQKEQVQLSVDFLSECFVPFEMKQKGYEELISKLRKQNVKLQKEVSRRKEVERKMNQSEKLFQQLIENALDVITVIDYEGIIRFESPSVETLLGYTTDELVGESVFEYIHPEDVEKIKSHLSDIANGLRSKITTQFRVRHAEGHYRCLESNANRVDEVLGIPGIVVNSRDVTQRVEAFKKLEKSQEQLKMAQKIALLGSWEWDLNDDDLEWSGELCKIYDVDEEDQPTTHEEFLEFIPEPDRTKTLSMIRRKFRKRDDEDFEFEHKIVLPDGEEKTLLARGKMISDNSGKPVKIIGTGQDITRIKKTEKKLRAYSEQLKELSVKKERIRENERIQIARKIHDELGQMLTILKMDLFVLQQKAGAGNAENFEDVAIEELKASIEKIDSITKSVQRIATDLRPPILDDLGLEEAIEWELTEFQKRSGIQTTFMNETNALDDLSEEESTAIFRIFQESLTNIMRHADAGSVEVRISELNKEVILEVSDDGVGINWDLINQTKSLGLLGMRERSQSLGGDISFSNAEEKGTSVRLVIPIKNRIEPD